MQNAKCVRWAFCVFALRLPMRSNTNSITFPLLDVFWVTACVGIALCLYGLGGSGAVGREAVADGFAFSMLLILGFSTACLWLGLKCFAKSQVRVHLVPEGIALSIFGHTFRTYPVEDLKLACFVDKGTYQESNVFLCVCCHDMKELALLRQQALRKNPYTRTNIPYRQRANNWQRTFAREYLRSRTSMLPWALPRKGIFYMVTSPERKALVEQMYPDLPWEDLTRLPEHYYQKPPLPDNMKSKEPESPEKFLRSHRHVEDLPLVSMAFVFAPCCLFLFGGIAFLEGFAGIVLSVVSMVWLFGSLFSLIPLEWKWISAREDGIHVRWGKREVRFLPEAEIRTVYCFDYKVKGGVCRYMAVTKLTPEEVVDRQSAYMRRNGRRRECLDAYSLAKNWPLSAQRRYLSRRMLLFGQWDRELLILAHAPEREEWLKALYPNAEWVDAAGIVNLNLFYPNLS